jgi:hypothetical protein
MMVKCDNDYLRCKDSLSYAKSKEKGLQILASHSLFPFMLS